MRRLLCIMTILVLCLTMAVPAFAADTFVPSITYKDGPDIESGTMEGEDVTGCLVVTSISQAKKKQTDITQDARDLLLEVYEQLDDGTMKLPIANDEYVIRELVDVSWMETACVRPGHGHEDWLEKDETTIEVRFDLGVKSDTDVIVLVYVDEQWVPAERVINRGDGTVVVEFERICPVVFCVESGVEVTPPKTGDVNGSQILLWSSILVGSVAAMLIIVILFKRSKDEEEEDK